MANAVEFFTDQDGISHIRLNRPEALNALNQDMLEGLEQALDHVEGAENSRVVLIGAAGGNFMAGGDIKMFYQTLDLPSDQREELFSQLIARVHKVIERLCNLPQPTMAVAQGAVAGFGLSLFCASDLAIVSDTTVFTLAYRHIGVSPDGGSTWHLERIVGRRRAMEIALLGERFGADQALTMGLVNKVVSIDDLQSHAHKLALNLARGPKAVLARTKALLNTSSSNSLIEQLGAEQQSFVASALEGDFREGVASFVEKRPAKFA